MLLMLLVMGAWLIALIGAALVMSFCTSRVQNEPLWFELTDDSLGWYKGLVALLVINCVIGGLVYFAKDFGKRWFASIFVTFLVTVGLILWKVSEYIIKSSDDKCTETSITCGGRAYERWNQSESNLYYLRLKLITGGISPDAFKNGTVTWAHDYCTKPRGALIGGLVLMLIFFVPVLSLPWIPES